LDAAGDQSFDAAIVDRSVPGGQDLEFVVRLRSIHPSLPVIVLSGWNGQIYVDEAIAAGARQYLAKPCSLDDIESAVRRALEADAQVADEAAR
jgi:DNA-binding NarL/FixJ family response regulator